MSTSVNSICLDEQVKLTVHISEIKGDTSHPQKIQADTFIVTPQSENDVLSFSKWSSEQPHYTDNIPNFLLIELGTKGVQTINVLVDSVTGEILSLANK